MCLLDIIKNVKVISSILIMYFKIYGEILTLRIERNLLVKQNKIAPTVMHLV